MFRLNWHKTAIFVGAFCATGLAIGNASFAKSQKEQRESERLREFLHVVAFEQGARQFAKGDEIVVKEVRGTADKIETGNIYWIKGTYKLASRDRAQISAYVTANNAADGTSKTLKVQTAIVKNGSGEFALYLPVYYDGLPHVSFYPADGGEGFGGTYFGTGDRVLKKWWGSGKTEGAAK